jgi:hypothetical protein
MQRICTHFHTINVKKEKIIITNGCFVLRTAKENERLLKKPIKDEESSQLLINGADDYR